MRKLLLIAAVMFSLGSMAQSPLRLAKEFKMAENNLKKVNNLMRVSLPSASTMKKHRQRQLRKENLALIISTSIPALTELVHFQNSTKQSMLFTVPTTRFTFRI